MNYKIRLYMRKLFSLFLVLGLILTSCEKDSGASDNRPEPLEQKIVLSTQDIVAECESQEYSIYVTSPDFWVATTQSEWIALTTDSGVSGTQELKFSVQSNEEVEGRVGSITVQNEAGTLSAELRVEQKAFVPTEIVLSSEALQYGCEGGRQVVTISANFAYEISADCDWMSYETVENGIAVIVESSKICQVRSTEIVVYSQKYEASKTIVVEQAPFVPYLEIEDVTTLEFDYAGGTQTISIASNFDYEIISNDDWLVIEKTEAGITVTVKPLYPVLNIPRETSFIIADRLYDFGNTEIAVSQHSKESDFNVGEMVKINDVVGVVFYCDADVTKIVSVEQGTAVWSTEYVLVGASDKDNGANNMAAIQSVNRWKSKYPAFAWCANLGDGWYLPAYNELYEIWSVKSELNEALVKNGYTAVGADYNYYYWSSTEYDENNVFTLYLYTGIWDRYYKYGEYYVRAVYQF